jgi:hypothetical protein
MTRTSEEWKALLQQGETTLIGGPLFDAIADIQELTRDLYLYEEFFKARKRLILPKTGDQYDYLCDQELRLRAAIRALRKEQGKTKTPMQDAYDKEVAKGNAEP